MLQKYAGIDVLLCKCLVEYRRNSLHRVVVHGDCKLAKGKLFFQNVVRMSLIYGSYCVFSSGC